MRKLENYKPTNFMLPTSHSDEDMACLLYTSLYGVCLQALPDGERTDEGSGTGNRNGQR